MKKWSVLESRLAALEKSLTEQRAFAAEIKGNSAFSWRVRALTTAQRDALYPTPFDSLLVYNTTLALFQLYYNGAWHNIGTLGAIDHGADLVGLADDDHPQHALLAGRNGGQTLIGDTAANGDLTLQSTSNGTRGSIICNDELIANGNSKVEANSTNATTCGTGAYTDIIFENEVTDLLSEFNTITGVFTAAKTGTYAVAWRVDSGSAAFATGEYWCAHLSRDNATTEENRWDGETDIVDTTVTRVMCSGGSAIITLAAGGTLRVKVFHNQGGNVNTNAYKPNQYFHIVRIA